MTKHQKTILAVTAAFAILVFAIAGFYLITTKSTPEPFSFTIAVNPNNGTIEQRGNTTIPLEAAYLNGTANPLTLSATGGPNGTIYTFSPQTLTPTKGDSLCSNLTITLPNANVTRTFDINITATTPDGITNSTTYTLTVLNGEILIRGTVTANGYPGVYPTKIEYINVNTDQIYWTPLDAIGPQMGTYTLIVPNHQMYEIICWSNFRPESGHQARGFLPMWLTIDCPTGTALTKDFAYPGVGLV